MRRFVWLFPALLLCSTSYAATYSTNRPTTTNNDDSCDISLLPAATLLLPYFEVDVTTPAGAGETTLFTITNTTEAPQAVRITLWTDYAYPVMSFNVYLTGYDVQSINLFDIIVRGRIAPDLGTGSDVSHEGELSEGRNNPLLDEASCINLPVQLPFVFIDRMRSAFTRGVIPAVGTSPACNNIGSTHTNAVGYATADVVGSCGNSLPTDAAYFGSDIRYDNVLIGDYMQVNGKQDYAQVNPMVHIRAIPEGGERNSAEPTNLKRTFYSRLLSGSATTIDRRQPLPHVFAARWIEGGATGFATSFKIWREAKTAANAGCETYATNSLPVIDIVRFDEEENPETLAPSILPFPLPPPPAVPSTSMLASDDEILPPNLDDAVAGWMYLNLDASLSDARATQNWVVVSMRAEGRFSGDMDAQALGNGCSEQTAASNAVGGPKPIGPAPNTTP